MTDLRKRPKVVVITGASAGLGRAIALALAHAGADVALGLRDVHSHGGLPAEIEALGRRALPLQMDVTSLDQIAGLLEEFKATKQPTLWDFHISDRVVSPMMRRAVGRKT